MDIHARTSRGVAWDRDSYRAALASVLKAHYRDKRLLFELYPKCPDILVRHGSVSVATLEEMRRLSDRVLSKRGGDWLVKLARANEAGSKLEPEDNYYISMLREAPRVPDDSRKSDVSDRQEASTVTCEEMYGFMQDGLQALDAAENVYLTSFQLEHPLDPVERVDSIVSWHRALKARVHDHDHPLRAWRLVAIQRVTKLRWLDEQVRDFGQGGVDFNVRLYGAPFEWQSQPGLATPLPSQVHVIGEHIFLAGVRLQSRTAAHDAWGTHIRAARKSKTWSYYLQQYEMLWKYAGANPPWGMRSSDLIVHGHVQEGTLAQLKAITLKSWLRYHASRVSTREDFELFLQLLWRTLFKEAPSDWWKAVGQPPQRGAENPYTREILWPTHQAADELDEDAESPVELMLAKWVPGASCAAHDHAGARGRIFVLNGSAHTENYWFDERQGILEHLPDRGRTFTVGQYSDVEGEEVHSTGCVSDCATTPLVTLHVYFKDSARADKRFNVFDLQAGVVAKKKNGGAWMRDAGEPKPFTRK